MKLRQPVLVATGILAGLVLSGFVISCGGSSSTPTATPAPSATTAPTTTTTAATSTTPVSGSTTNSSSSSSSASTTASSASTTVKVATVPSLGQILTDSQGLTLYTYKGDVPNSGKSTVSGTLAQNWPPLTLAGGSPVATGGITGQLALITRTDGSMQVTYNGMPLYRFAGDKAPGDTTGQGLGNAWYVATP